MAYRPHLQWHTGIRSPALKCRICRGYSTTNGRRRLNPVLRHTHRYNQQITTELSYEATHTYNIPL